MVAAVERRIWHEARRSARHNGDHSPEDYAAEAVIGLLAHAIPNFDPKRTRWITYSSWWIKAKCWALADRNRMIALPSCQIERAHREGGPEQVAKLRAQVRVDSLDTPIGDYSERLLVDLVADEDPDDDATVEDDLDELLVVRQFVWACMAHLGRREAYILMARHFDEATLQTVARTVGISRERVRQHADAALVEVLEHVPDAPRPMPRGCPGLAPASSWCGSAANHAGLCTSHWLELLESATEARPACSPKRRRCLCCGRGEAAIFRLPDRRLYAACERCTSGCDFCGPKLAGAVLVRGAR
jgi:RNA polymerase sigma factor (sigma-70 family)